MHIYLHTLTDINLSLHRDIENDRRFIAASLSFSFIFSQNFTKFNKQKA